jgi:hypothetical protein
VDPSFLAALPENIRQEVIAEQLRLQRIQARAQQQQQQSAETPGVMEVNPEFLAALPPNIQEEVSTVLGVQLSICRHFTKHFSVSLVGLKVIDERFKVLLEVMVVIDSIFCCFPAFDSLC